MTHAKSTKHPFGVPAVVRIVLLALTLLLVLPADAGARRRFEPYRWDHTKVIVVENRMGPEWNDAVKFTVRGWKRAFPKLHYRIVNNPGKCGWAKDRLVICRARGFWVGQTTLTTKGRSISEGLVQVSPDPDGPMWDTHVSMFDMTTLCHEFGHALALNHNMQPAHSCIANRSKRIAPGKYDRQSLRLLYKREWPA